jgi:hypothetical protein
MLRPMRSSTSLASPATRLDEIGGRTGQVVITSLELLEVLGINQASLPQILEEGKVGSTRSQRLAIHDVLGCDMVHARGPGYMPAAFAGVCRPVTQWALHF